MISTRYALPAALLLTLALIPTIIHSYLGSKMDDGMRTEEISSVLNGFTSVPAKRNKRWGEDVFDSKDWVERIYERSGTPKVRLFVARSYDHKRLYHHPELALSYGRNLKDDGLVLLRGEFDIPVHLLRGRESSELIAYALLYDGQYIEDPISHQIRDAFSLLFRPRKAMTLFYVSISNALRNEDIRASPSASVLLAAIQSFRSQASLSVQ